MKHLIALICISIIISCGGKKEPVASNPEAEIRSVMAMQQDAWNEGNIETFMEGYWKSDSMQFVGKTIRQGWQATLERYKESYPNLEAMGQLQFDLWQVVRISDEAYLVTGQYTLTRTNDKPSGAFTLIFKLKNKKWVIVYDHTG